MPKAKQGRPPAKERVEAARLLREQPELTPQEVATKSGLSLATVYVLIQVRDAGKTMEDA